MASLRNVIYNFMNRDDSDHCLSDGKPARLTRKPHYGRSDLCLLLWARGVQLVDLARIKAQKRRGTAICSIEDSAP